MSVQARADILAAAAPRLEQRPVDPASIAAAAAALLADPAAARPALATPPVEQFVAQVTAARLGATLERIAAITDLPAAVAAYLAARGLAPRVAVPPAPALLALDWRQLATSQTIASDEVAALGVALWGIAETGSLVFHSGPQAPTLFNFLPLHHIVLLPAMRVLPHLEDYIDAFAATGAPAPRTASLITGVSGTTDIEGSYVRGAHGPRFLHIMLLENRA